jgi:hypothetical protein
LPTFSNARADPRISHLPAAALAGEPYSIGGLDKEARYTTIS